MFYIVIDRKIWYNIKKCYRRFIVPYLLLLVGFIFLIKGADLFVDGASSIASKLKIPSLIIGLTVVSMGTSAPEAAISISASLTGSGDISLGNIIGSNLFNLLIVIGVCAVICPVVSDKDIIRRDMPLNIGVTGAMLIMMLDGKLGRIDALIMLTVFILYLVFLIVSTTKNRDKNADESEGKSLSWTISVLFSVIGVAGIVFGGDMVVDNAQLIAKQLGMSNTLIGLTVVALGTSLPELVTSVVAARKNKADIALGNAVGSCLFNFLFVFGLAGVIKPMQADPDLVIDAAILLGVTVMMLIFAITKKRIGRIEGVACVLVYLLYTAYIIMRTYHFWIF